MSITSSVTATPRLAFALISSIARLNSVAILAFFAFTFNLIIWFGLFGYVLIGWNFKKKETIKFCLILLIPHKFFQILSQIL